MDIDMGTSRRRSPTSTRGSGVTVAVGRWPSSTSGSASMAGCAPVRGVVALRGGDICVPSSVALCTSTFHFQNQFVIPWWVITNQIMGSSTALGSRSGINKPRLSGAPVVDIAEIAKGFSCNTCSELYSTSKFSKNWSRIFSGFLYIYTNSGKLIALRYCCALLKS